MIRIEVLKYTLLGLLIPFFVTICISFLTRCSVQEIRNNLLCPYSCVFIFLLRFHVSTLLSSTACLFGACHGRMPQPVLTCASVVVQIVTSVDGEFDGGI